jgi:hypothetical protein
MEFITIVVLGTVCLLASFVVIYFWKPFVYFKNGIVEGIKYHT